MGHDAEIGASLDVCIWFEADPQHHDRIVASFLTLVQAVEALPSPVRPAGSAPHTRARLLRRPELAMRETGPRSTWMEIWPGIASTQLQVFLVQLEQLAAQTGLNALASGPRHVEPFLIEIETRALNRR
ncbi:MAG: DUF4936 family protein [Burkholderiales bacterium]